MIKLNSFNGDSFMFFESIVNSKRNSEKKPNLKNELSNISSTQRLCFDLYDSEFSNNSLINIKPTTYCKNDMDNLQNLYSYRNKKIQELKNSLTIHPFHKKRILNTCQNCTINEADTMDHILSQKKFPEFSVHPKNLFPCCSVCNKKKSDNYTDSNGNQLFLNLFLDELPKSQYLYVDFDKNWTPRFFLQHPCDVSDDMFSLIESHYTRLDLLNRFRESSNITISTLESTISSYKSCNITTEQIKNSIEVECSELGDIYGYNHREIILKRALGSSDEFISYCKNR